MNIKIGTGDGLLSPVITLILIVGWVGGAVLSNGFWSCLISTIIPPYAWYITLEKLMMHYNFLIGA